MGCSASRIDDLPAVSLCHHRCKFLEEALHQSYALSDAHVSYFHSLRLLGPTLRRFFHQNNLTSSDSPPNPPPADTVNTPNPLNLSSPERSPARSNSDSHIDFRSDSEDEEFRGKDFDLLHRINPNRFGHQTIAAAHHQPDSCSYGDQTRYDSYRGNYGGSAWKTPSPPPPPNSSAWDFLNFFDAYERYEFLPKHEFGNRIHGNDELGKKQANLVGGKDRNPAKLKEDRGNPKKNEADAVKTNFVLQKEQKKEANDSGESNNGCVHEVITEIESLFERAAGSGNEVLKMLDTGKFRYCDKNFVCQGFSSRMFHVAVTPSFSVLPSKSTEPLFSTAKNSDEDLAVISVNLSSTLKKLCMWEKKLYDEVKAEEKMRVIHVKNYRQIKRFGEKGAAANKVDSARTLLRTLSIKIKVAIHVIDRISTTISTLRDEELWPQICEFINKLVGMWKAMLECHKCQSQAVVKSRISEAISCHGKFSDADFEATVQLKIELLSWNVHFCNWITAQKGFVKAMNGWLLKCFPNESEQTPDGESPFFPARIGAPPVFVLYTRWARAMDSVSEVEVIDAINGFLVTVNQLLERHYVYIQQRITADKDMEKKLKILEREEQRLQKLVQAQGNKTFLSDRNMTGIPSSAEDITKKGNLQLGLKNIFMAIERFSENIMQVYEELQVYMEESRITPESQERS